MALYTSISICSGVGMLDHAIDIATNGSNGTVLYVEREAFAVANLAWQMESGFLSPAPVWSDVKSLISMEVIEYVDRCLSEQVLDFLYGGIPCQPWSVAGKQDGADDERDLWPATLAAIGKYKPGIVFIENVPGILNQPMGGERIVRDLGANGYRVTAGLFSSEEMGASHARERVFIMGHHEDKHKNDGIEYGRKITDRGTGTKLADCYPEGLAIGDSFGTNAIKKFETVERAGGELGHYTPGRNQYDEWERVAQLEPSRMPCVESEFRRVADGVARRIDRIRAVGNGVDPLVAAYEFVTLSACLLGE